MIRDRDMMKKSIIKAEEENMKNKDDIINYMNEIKKLNEEKKGDKENIASLLK